jgi:hypothetical protein
MFDNLTLGLRHYEAVANPAWTRAAQALLAEAWGQPVSPVTSSPLGSPVLAEFGAFDVVGAFRKGRAPTFGQYANCSSLSRCVGCSADCDTESALADFAGARRRPLLLVIASGQQCRPDALRIIPVAAGLSWSGGVFVPVISRGCSVLTLATADGGMNLLARPDGLSHSAITPSVPVHVMSSDRALHAFLRAFWGYAAFDRHRGENAATASSLVA